MNWINVSYFLAAEASESHSGGFGINFDILETNILNIAIVVSLLVYFGRSFLGNVLSKRQSDIEAAIADAEQRMKTAAAALVEQQQKLAQAQQEAERIKAAAVETAKVTKQAIIQQAQQDVERMKASAVQELSNEQERVMADLRQRVVALALQQAESQLPDRLNDDEQQRLIDRSVAMMGG